jgi:hypothetical protein
MLRLTPILAALVAAASAAPCCLAADMGSPVPTIEERVTALEAKVAALEKKCADCCPCGPDCECPPGVCPDCPAKATAKPAKGGHWNCGPGGCQWIPDRPSAAAPAEAPPKPAGDGWQYDASLKAKNPACTGWYRAAPSPAVSAPAPVMRPVMSPVMSPVMRPAPMPSYAPAPTYTPSFGGFRGGCPGGNCPTGRCPTCR